MIIAVIQASRQRKASGRHVGTIVDTARGAVLPGGWEIIADGWSWLHENGHIGLVGRNLAQTKEEAEGIMNRINAAVRETSK